jgi:hypothetical protein
MDQRAAAFAWKEQPAHGTEHGLGRTVSSITRDTGVKHHLRQRLLSARVDAVAGNIGAAAREDLLYELKGGSLRSPPRRLRAAASGRPRRRRRSGRWP